MTRPRWPGLPRHIPLSMVYPLLGLLNLLIANTALNRHEMTGAVAFMIGIGLVLWALSLLWSPGHLFRPSREPITVTEPVIRAQKQALSIAVLSGMCAYVWAADNMYRPFGVVTWVIAVVAWTIAWWPTSDGLLNRTRRWVQPFRSARLETWTPSIDGRKLVTIVAVVLAVGVGAFFRFYEIDQTPLDPTSDHAEKLLDVTDVLTGKRPIFFERNTGREPMQFYLSAALFKVFDLPTNFVSLKMGTALIGTLTIPFIFLLASELAGRFTGVVATWLFAVCAWPVEISRAGLRFPYAPFAAAPALWFLLRWMRTRDRRDALCCGLCIGVGLHGYTPIRIVVPALMLGMLIAFVDPRWKAWRRRTLVDSGLIGLTAGVVFIPLGRYSIEHPDMFWFRAADRVASDSGQSAFSALVDNLSVFLRNNWNAAIGFNWRGDSTMVNAVSYAPILDWVTGALLLAGLAIVLTQCVTTRDPRVIFIVLSLPILLLSSTLAISFPIENPSVNREGPAAPIIFTIIALPLGLLMVNSRITVGRRLGPILIVALTVLLTGTAASRSFNQYFTAFDRQTRLNVANTTEIAHAIQGAKSLGVSQDDAYIIDRAYWLDLRNIGIAMGDINWGFTHNVLVDDPLPTPLPDRPMLLIVNANDDVRLPEIRQTYPGAIVTAYPVEVPEKAFVTVWVPPSGESSR